MNRQMRIALIACCLLPCGCAHRTSSAAPLAGYCEGYEGSFGIYAGKQVWIYIGQSLKTYRVKTDTKILLLVDSQEIDLNGNILDVEATKLGVIGKGHGGVCYSKISD